MLKCAPRPLIISKLCSPYASCSSEPEIEKKPIQPEVDAAGNSAAIRVSIRPDQLVCVLFSCLPFILDLHSAIEFNGRAECTDGEPRHDDRRSASAAAWVRRRQLIVAEADHTYTYTVNNSRWCFMSLRFCTDLRLWAFPSSVFLLRDLRSSVSFPSSELSETVSCHFRIHTPAPPRMCPRWKFSSVFSDSSAQWNSISHVYAINVVAFVFSLIVTSVSLFHLQLYTCIYFSFAYPMYPIVSLSHPSNSHLVLLAMLFYL